MAVSPSMCGQTSLFAARIGDWTWEAVSKACDIDVLTATSPAGHPAYLSFYSYRLIGSRAVYPTRFTFGDRLAVSSRVFGLGGESVLTLHRIASAGQARQDDGAGPVQLEASEAYEHPDPDCLYVENVNRWVSRAGATGNTALVRGSPAGFRQDRLPRLPPQYSPRALCAAARRTGTLATGLHECHERMGKPFETHYRVDPVRDLNGAGLLYFATYFSIVDSAVFAAWRAMGRPDRQFARRRIIDQRLCYFGNADAGSALAIAVTTYRSRTDPLGEMTDVSIRDDRSGRLLALSLLHQ
ncbi:LnmK family bifunctional acyltransferase/decarboxylase [Streptomyces sp. NPDC098789]|uniref:LnmK family bifunctional acyltransferase/decarboxylase n=1 Tax=Streptomyces sp. NPDC098789 TaxID=3366098 RepID=UPI00382D7ED5